MEQEQLIKKVQSYNPDLDVEFLKKACEFSKRVHGTQLRASGDPYYSHPLEVAFILAEMKLDVSTIVTALLHDTVEDTDTTLEDIEDLFGLEIRSLVDGVTKLAKIEFQSEHTRQAENFRKLLIAMSEDIRVLIVKLADRTHNMRTLHYIKSPEKRLRIAHETMEIFSPLAERLGIQNIKNELQELAFSHMHPEVMESITSRLSYLRERENDIVDKVIFHLEETIKNANIENAVISGREKTPCSIWRKMERKNVAFEQLSDIIAFRILVDKYEDCYLALGAVHRTYTMIPDSFKDFISTPKENGYQSLHTVVMGPETQRIEIQIRTKEMHRIAEYGVAAHWSYKQGAKINYDIEARQYKWLRELLNIMENATDSDEFLENTKLEMYYDQVFCFSPKGDLYVLPKGSTTVDFAYAVHSDIGHHCSGAKINGRIVPLRTMLHNGDQVEILTSKGQSPSSNWEKFVITGRAKGEIKRFTRAQKRFEYISLGKSMITKFFKNEKYEISDKILKKSLKNFNKKSIDDLFFSVGEGDLAPIEVFNFLYPDKKSKLIKKNPLTLLMRKKKNIASESIPINGLIPGMAFSLGECCHPIPGDKIVGIITPGKGMTVHDQGCEILENFNSTPERWVDVSWPRDIKENEYFAKIKAVIAHEPGSLSALTSIIAKNNGNISNLKFEERTLDYFQVTVYVAVKGAKHLNDIITALRVNKLIHSVSRIKNA